LGNNAAPTNASSPVSVVGDRQFKKIYTTFGSANTAVVAIDINGYAWAWGYGGYGQLGNNATANTSSPVSVVGGKQWIDVVIGTSSVWALDDSSYAWSWGANGLGQLGCDTQGNKSSPVSVIGGKQWKKIVIGPLVPLFIDSSDYVWTWSDNGNGEAGDGTTTLRSSPVSVIGGRQYSNASIAADSGCMALDTTGNLWVWGNNGGTAAVNLGDGTAENRSSPVLSGCKERPRNLFGE
jgi:alpha-tubulin suppressor-like RCC1 family protein